MDEYVSEKRTDGKTDEIGERLLQTLCLYGKREYANEGNETDDGDAGERIKPDEVHAGNGIMSTSSDFGRYSRRQCLSATTQSTPVRPECFVF